jgi:phage major head subunit gpT-like protein
MPTWLHELESNMQTIVERAYTSLLDSLWWTRVAAKKNSVSKKEVFVWLISTATIKNMESGQADFEDMLSQYTEIENKFASAGLELKKDQLEDLYNGTPGGEGLALATRWAQDVGAQAAYWPQKKVAEAILDGAASGSTTYDGLTFFNTGHYLNGKSSDDGTFSNILNPTVLGVATRIDSAVTLDAAVENLSRVRAYISEIKMPNGKDPRNLKIKAILHPPAMRSRIVQLTQGSLIAQDAASGGGGGADVEPVIKDWMLEKPLQAPELAASYSSPAGNSGSDTSYYVIANESPGEGELGAMVYQDREPFNVLYHGPEASDRLARTRELQYLMQGRNTVGYGHPYQLFRVDAA